jgi:hypothetical protein
MLLSHPEEAAEAEHRVSNVAAELIDQELSAWCVAEHRVT